MQPNDDIEWPAMLVVEDDPLVRESAVGIFEEHGVTVFSAAHGAEALAVLDQHPEIGLVFSDMRMPVMGGRELATAALKRRPDLKIVLTTGNSSPSEVPTGLTMVRKPYRPNTLLSTCRQELRRAS